MGPQQEKKTTGSAEPQADATPIYRDRVPLGTRFSEASLPKLSILAAKPAEYQTDPTSRKITNTEALGLTAADDDPLRPNVAVLDTPNQVPEQRLRTADGQVYEIHGSHLRHVIETIPERLELRSVYNLADKGTTDAIQSSHLCKALGHLLEHAADEDIKYLNTSFTREMSYSEAGEMMAAFGPKDTSIVSPESLRSDQVQIADGLRKYLASPAGRDKYPDALEEARLVQALIDKGITVVADAGKNPETFNPIHVLVPDIVVVTRLSYGANIDLESTDHSLVDTANWIDNLFDDDPSRRRGASFSTSPVLSIANKFAEQGRNPAEINEALLADFNVRIRSELNTVALPSAQSLLKSLLEVLAKKDNGRLESSTIETARKNLLLISKKYTNEALVLEIIRDNPDVSPNHALGLLKALDRSLPGGTLPAIELRAVYEKFAALPPGSRDPALEKLSQGTMSLEQAKALLDELVSAK